MPSRPETVRAIAVHEFRAAARGRIVHAFTLLFAGLAVGIAIAGLGASGHLHVQSFSRTGASLLTLALYLLPLLGLLLGAGEFGDDDGMELLIAQPIRRNDALVGRLLGLAATLAAVALAGFGAAAIVIAIGAGGAGIAGYALVAGVGLLAGFAGLTLGALVGACCRRRGTAVGWALALWLGAAVLYDLAAIAILQLTGNGRPGPALVALLAFNPIDGLRALALVGLGADVLLGPAGAALRQLLGGSTAACVLGAALAWIGLPVVALARAYSRRDF
ncbi:MAG TPA: ABC transporter permease subunit [Longimicrobiales bacterium]